MNLLLFRRKIFLPLMFSFIFTGTAIVSYSQGVYEVKYKFYEKGQDGRDVLGQQEYSSIIFFYDANNPQNVMRTRYYDVKEGWMVVEQKIKVTTKFINGKNNYVMDGMSPKYISPSTTLAKYNPDHIVLSKNANSNDYKPEYVYDDANTVGAITGFKILNTSDINSAYLAPYKWKWTPTTTTTTTTTTVTNKPKFDLSKSTLHVVFVTNSTDPKLGDGFAVNQQMMQDLFKSAAQACNMRFNKVEVKGYDFNKQNVQSAISNLSSTSNDIIVFYYSGHGFRVREQNNNWPLLDLRGNPNDDLKASALNLEYDIYRPLALKNPRLLMVVGECCNVYLDNLGTPSIPAPLTMPLGSTIMNENTVKALFSKRGRILIATSKPKEYTWYYNDKGGFFGSNFKSAFQKSVGFSSNNTNINWTDIFKDAIKYTVQRTESGEGGTQPQHPISHFDLY